MHKIFFHIDDFGRSKIISEKILNTIKFGSTNSVSVMMGFVNKKIHKKILKTKIKTKLHLNLTESPKIGTGKNKKKFDSLNFIKLIFLNQKEKKILKKEINEQINDYTNIYGKNNLRVDGHQHIHIIPWIHDYLVNNRKYNIKEIRYPNEKIWIFKYKILFKFKFYRNLLALLVVKFLILFIKKKKYSPEFFGLLYTGLYNQKILQKNFKYVNKKKHTEILIHGGHTNKSEKKFFKKDFFKHYSSNENKTQYKLALKKNLLK